MGSRLKQILGSHFSEAEAAALMSSFDVVGDIAIVVIPDLLAAKQDQIAEAILGSNTAIKVVAKRTARYSGEFRTAPLQIIGGENRKETEVREHGVRMRVNPEKVYFSIRSGGERRRIASLVEEGEEVLVLFSGIGPFPLIISKYSKASHITGIEKNAEAHGYGLVNLGLNKRLSNITLIQGDVADILPSLSVSYDRIIMVLPTRGEEYLPYIYPYLKERGFVHFYDMQNKDNFTESIRKVEMSAAHYSREMLSARAVRCGHCGPYTYRICVDAQIN